MDIEKLWQQGKIGSRQCLSQQIALLKGGWDAIVSLLPQITIDPSFPSFVRWCQQQNIPFALVNEGMDRVIQAVLEQEGLHVPIVRANHLYEWADGRISLQFPNASPDHNCQAGLCKCRMLQLLFPETQGTDVHRIVIGDGFSDQCWAQQADTVFAKHRLQRFCQDNPILFPLSHSKTLMEFEKY
jgi:2-hydroxy-3-keto-5-methylthiopentenyl-1-phosphate phosphatase